MSDPKITPTETIERVDTGFRLKIESTRGTGTRDEDTVKIEAKTETKAELEAMRDDLVEEATETMIELRSNQPDQEDDDA